MTSNCCDPWPVENDPENQHIVEMWLDDISLERGFMNWTVAYHNAPEGQDDK